MKLREALARAVAEARAGNDKYQRTFEIMHGPLPSDDERAMIKRLCLWYENEQAQPAAA